MTHPDHEQIACTLLRCDGYKNADINGKKIVEVFSCARFVSICNNRNEIIMKF